MATHQRAQFVNLLIDAAATAHHRPLKRPRPSSHLFDSDCEMPYFNLSTTHHLAPPTSLLRKRSERLLPSRNEVDEYLSSSDLELSFASNVSLNSPPRLLSNLPECEPMDISPMPNAKVAHSGGPSATVSLKTSRARAMTAGSRLFGSDLSNSNPLLPSPKLTDTTEPKPSGTTTNRKLGRAPLPAEWLSAMRPPESEPEQVPTQPSSPVDDAMDVDTSYMVETVPAIAPVNFLPQSAAPTTTGFSNFFFDTLSPRRSLDSPKGPMSKKRRSLSPESNRAMVNEAMSSPLPPSPSESKLDRMNAANKNAKPGLQGLGAPSASFVKRPRRPVLSELVPPLAAHGAQSAYPILSPSGIGEGSGRSSIPPPRRAVSALLPPSIYCAPESDESSFDADGPDMSSPAQAYAKRQQVKTIRRCDGTEDFRPLTGATAMVMKESPSSRHLSAGLPGFGDNEAHGKILPCHRVTEDGLMRIKPKTVDDLLDGRFDRAIHDYHIIDCRFDYEYAGGHIRGAVNINTTAGVEELLLGPSLTKPRPSMSGDSTRKTILVFHCEFSAKRAPTFAKHLRAKDRAMNNHNYPKIHYPEVYILEGGYCQYFKSAANHRCEPQAYVTMDDPNHALSRREDLDQFRKAKFGRHKSYAYGDGSLKPTTSSQQVQPKRNTAPTSLFAAAASAARSRRTASVNLMTLAEDANTTAEADHDDTDTDLGDSPCPPPTKSNALKSKKQVGRNVLIRAETYNPIRMPF